MGGFLFSYSISIDDELGLTGKDYFGAFLQGRFLIGLLDLLVPTRVTPLYPYLLLALSYVATYTIILYIHGLKHNWKTHLGYLAFILFPTNWLSQEFNVNVPGFAVGQLFAALAALQTRESFHGLAKRLGGSLVGWSSLSPVVIGLLILAIGGFQSLITVYLAISIGAVLFQNPRANPEQAQPTGSEPMLGQRLGFIFSNTIAALALHTLIFKIILIFSKSEIRQVNIYFRSPYFMLRTQPWPYITGNIHQFFQTYLTPGIFYGLSLSAFAWLLIYSAVLLARSIGKGNHLKVNNLKGWQVIVLCVLLLVIPLSLNVISTPYRIPMRALMALPYVAWLATTICLTLSAKRSFSFLLAVALSSLLAVQCVITISGYYASRAMNQRSDQLLASTIASAVIQSNKAGSGARPITRLASMGAIKRTTPHPTAMYSTASSSFFNWDNGNPARMVAWLQLIGLEGLTPVSKTELDQYLPYFSSMKSWPAPGSIQVKDETVLVKLGDTNP